MQIFYHINCPCIKGVQISLTGKGTVYIWSEICGTEDMKSNQDEVMTKSLKTLLWLFLATLML